MRKPKISQANLHTTLDRVVARIINRHADDYDDGAEGFINDVMKGGCQSGIIGDLIYYTDTLRFYKRHREDISALVKEMQESTGESIGNLLRDFDQDDPLCLDTSNQNLLAWFGFEETARVLADRQGWEV